MAAWTVPLIPLSSVVFPHQSGFLDLSDRDLVSFLHAEYQKGNCDAGVFLKKDDRNQRGIVSSVSDVYGVGTLVKILDFQVRNEKCRLHINGLRCISLKGILPWSSDGSPQSEPQPANHVVDGEESMASTYEDIPMEQTPNRDEKFLTAQIENLYDEIDATKEKMEALYQDIKKSINDTALIPGPEVQVNFSSEFDLGIWAYKLASLTPSGPHEKQHFLEENKIWRRLRLVLLLLTDLKMPMVFDEFKIIHDKCVAIKNNEAYPKAVRDAANKVMTKSERKYDEYNKFKNYSEILTSLPWTVLSPENLDVELAKTTLDEDLIGLEDVKLGILSNCFIQSAQGRTFFIYGPPGAGKKSIGKAIARALNRKCAMVDMKCMMDEAELLGKEMVCGEGWPGKIVKSLKETGTMNPVILLNGVDMAWRETRKRICDALINLQLVTKSSFQDNYLGFEMDLSKVLFVCIASDITIIPDDLLNNQLVMEVTGYFLHEKLKIARNCLIPAKLVIDDSAIVKLVLEYCKELGVNHLKRMIESIARAKDYEVSRGQDESMTVNKENVESYLQESKRQRVYETTPVGVVRGLAYDHKSSFAFYIEALACPGENANICTGHLGERFKESVDVAVSCVKNKMPKLNNSWFHINVPPGVVPKNGTSAGIAIVAAIMSWILQKPVPQDMAMTGEVTPLGAVLPVSGIRQKMIAAEKEGVTCIFLPKENENDYGKLPECFKRGRTVYFVSHCSEVIPELD